MGLALKGFGGGGTLFFSLVTLIILDLPLLEWFEPGEEPLRLPKET